MSKEVQTAPCRFCGQMVQIEAEGKLTEPQAAEEATMHCTCAEAVEYQKEKQRKEKAMKKCLRTVWRGCSTGQENR